MQHIADSSCIGQSNFRRGDETDVDQILTISDTTWGRAPAGAEKLRGRGHHF